MGRTLHALLLAGVVCSLLAVSGCAGNRGPMPTEPDALRKMAEAGNPIAANNLGMLYAAGKNVPQDFAEAKKWYLFASEHGNPVGEYNLGYAYEFGQGTAIDLPEAVRWYHIAIDHNVAAAKLQLGSLYSSGKGVPHDDAEAARLALAAARQGFPFAQIIVGSLYIDGLGVPPDDSMGYQWASIGASKLTGAANTFAAKIRDNAAQGLSPTELAQAQAAAGAWRPGTDVVSIFPPGSPPRPIRLRGSGSGFIIGKGGEIATDYHVVPNCAEVRLTDADGTHHATTHRIADDKANDMAILGSANFGTRLKLRTAPVGLGESITSYGFPLGPVLASTGNLTSGSVSATTGMKGDQKAFQITAPEQPGNSGGPVVDETGAVVGIVASKLNALIIAAATGDVPQNVNFAWRASQLQTLLDQKGIAYETAAKGTAKSGVDIAALLQKGTVKIECWR
jgi:S1-C subfamily serine protease